MDVHESYTKAATVAARFIGLMSAKAKAAAIEGNYKKAIEYSRDIVRILEDNAWNEVTVEWREQAKADIKLYMSKQLAEINRSIAELEEKEINS